MEGWLRVSMENRKLLIDLRQPAQVTDAALSGLASLMKDIYFDESIVDDPTAMFGWLNFNRQNSRNVQRDTLMAVRQSVKTARSEKS